MKIAVCFLSVDPNHFNLVALKEQALSSSKHTVDIYTYINDKDVDYVVDADNIIHFDYNYLVNKIGYKRQEPIYHHPAMGKNVGLEFLPVIDMYMNHKDEYDFYIYYEDDVSYFGSTNLFDTIDFDCDVIFQNRRHNAVEDKWYWTTDEQYNLSNVNTIYYGLTNVYALKNFVNQEFIDYVLQGNYCHPEGLVSTFVLNNEKYKVNYIDDVITSYSDFNDNAPINGDYDFVHPVKTYVKYILIKRYHDR